MFDMANDAVKWRRGVRSYELAHSPSIGERAELPVGSGMTTGFSPSILIAFRSTSGAAGAVAWMANPSTGVIFGW